MLNCTFFPCSSLVEEDGQKKASVDQATAVQPNGAATGNNYYRSEGQNVGNFITDKPSSRVLAPPGGGSQISFGAESAPTPDGKVWLLLGHIHCSYVLGLLSKLYYVRCGILTATSCGSCRGKLVSQRRAQVCSWVEAVLMAAATTTHVPLVRTLATS